VVTGGVGAGGLATGVVVVVGRSGAGGVVGGATGGLLGLAGGGFGVGRRSFGCGMDRFGSEGVVAVGRMITVGRTTAIFGATLCG
jgi:hypothetical protein